MKMKRTSFIEVAIAFTLIIGTTVAFAVSAAAKNSNIMPQDETANWAAYDETGKFLYYRAIDENGNDVFLDCTPKPPDGDARVKGYEDTFSFFSEKIDCLNGVSGEHRKSNGEMAVYMNNGGAWSLRKGQTVEITFNTKAVKGHEDGQGIWFGYLKDGQYVRYGDNPNIDSDQRYILLEKTTILFNAPEDGNYCFFMINFSSDTIYVNSCSVSV